MDSMSCTDGGVGPPSDNKEFCGFICPLHLPDDSTAKFPVEKDRYILYVAAGCPFAARPWVVQALYGLPIEIVKLFPATADDGWFFEPKSEAEKDLAGKVPMDNVDPDPYGHHHLSQLYEIANPDFSGAISLPLLWDKVHNTAVNNSSLALAEMFCQHLKPQLATRNHDVELLPDTDEERKEHGDLFKWIEHNVTMAVYRIVRSGDIVSHDVMVEEYYQALTKMQDRLLQNDEASSTSSSSAYLMGDKLRLADILLWISLVRLDLVYQFRFGLGKYNIREDFPRLKAFVAQIMSIPGVSEAIIPRDIMCQYYLSHKWEDVRSLPMVPAAWEKCLEL